MDRDSHILAAIIDYLVDKVRRKELTKDQAIRDVERIVVFIVEHDEQDAIPLSEWLQERLAQLP